MINVFIDEITPCLSDAKTGELVQTEVIQITRKSFLRKYNKKNGWYTDWDKLIDDNEVYALVVEGSVDIQGLVSVVKDDDAKACYISWMCASPENNHQITEELRYKGVGGHLFAIAAKKSIDFGFDGMMYGFAANKILLDHYIEKFNAEFVGILHPFQFAIDEENAKNIMEVYTYDWTDEKL